MVWYQCQACCSQYAWLFVACVIRNQPEHATHHTWTSCMDLDNVDEHQSLLQQLERHGEQFCEQFGIPLKSKNVGSCKHIHSVLEHGVSKTDGHEEPTWEGISNVVFYKAKSVPIMDQSGLKSTQRARESTSHVSGKDFMVCLWSFVSAYILLKLTTSSPHPYPESLQK